jgi:hypothetical protein
MGIAILWRINSWYINSDICVYKIAEIMWNLTLSVGNRILERISRIISNRRKLPPVLDYLSWHRDRSASTNNCQGPKCVHLAGPAFILISVPEPSGRPPGITSGRLVMMAPYNSGSSMRLPRQWHMLMSRTWRHSSCSPLCRRRAEVRD